MSRIAVLWRGPIRQDVNQISSNMETLITCLEAEGHIVDGYFITWRHPELSQLLLLRPELNVISLAEMEKDLALSKLTTRCRTVNLPGHHWTPENNYKQFWTTRLGLDLIAQTEISYDQLVLSRPDLNIKISDVARNWMSTDTYSMPDVAVYNGFNDQFAVAPLSIARTVWDTSDLRKLNQLYGSSENPEEVLRRLAEERKILLMFKHPVAYAIRGKQFV